MNLSFLWPIIYVLLGAVLATLISGACRRLQQTKIKDEFPTFFLNILLLNKKDVLKSEVKKKVKYGLFGLRQRIAAAAVSTVVSDHKFTNGVAEKIALGIPPKLKLNAIEANSELMFVEKNYAVIAVTIHKVDAMVLVSKQVDGIGKAAFHVGKVSIGETILDWVGKVSFGAKKSAEYALNSSLVPVVENKMVEMFGPQLMKKLQVRAGVDCVVEVKHAKDQPAYFYKFIKLLRNPRMRSESIVDGTEKQVEKKKE